jgi:hypothetical protein
MVFRKMNAGVESNVVQVAGRTIKIQPRRVAMGSVREFLDVYCQTKGGWEQQVGDWMSE